MRVLAKLVAALLVTTPILGSAQSQTDRFELECTNSEAGAPKLRFSVFITVNGAEVTNLGKSPPVEYKAAVYANALSWGDGKYEHEADRFTGILKVTPNGATTVARNVVSKSSEFSCALGLVGGASAGRAAAETEAPNPSVERTFQRPLRALWSTAHVAR
jgi:hypothetical protein